MNYLWIMLVITASVGWYYWGKHRGLLEAEQDFWLREDSLVGQIKNLKEDRDKWKHLAGTVELQDAYKVEHMLPPDIIVKPKPKRGRPRTK